MLAEQIKSIAIIGAGQMGRGIAQVCATSGYSVCLMDQSKDQLDMAIKNIAASSQKLLTKQKLSTEQCDRVHQIQTYTQLSKLPACDFVIEAVSEKESLKKEIFQALDEIMPQSTIFASNTSSISITRLAACVSRPSQFIGLHFMNPVPIMKLIEVIKGLATDQSTYTSTLDLAQKLGKQVSTSQDTPGFVVNRILMPMINEAFMTLMQGTATREDIDKGMKLGTNQPMGPLELADFIGLDTCLSIMEVLHEGFCDSKYRPSPLLRQYVDAGWLGRKSKKGVYSY